MELEKCYQIKEKLFQCPICVKIPLSDIFQCENGHMLCHQCIFKSGAKCPTCRVPFGVKKIRVLALEAILDEVLMPCPFKKCTQTMKRREIINHQKICNFRSVNICKNLGYPDCKKVCGSYEQLSDHLNNVHRCCANWDYDHDIDGEYSTELITYSKDIPAVQTKYIVKWCRAKTNGGDESFLVVVKIVPNPQGHTLLHCAVIFLSDRLSPPITEYSTNNKIEIVHGYKHYQICSWEGSLVHYKAAEDENKIPYFITSINYMKTRLVPGEGTDFLISVYVDFKGPTLVLDCISEDDSDSSGEDESKLECNDSDESQGSNAASSLRQSKRQLPSESDPSPKKPTKLAKMD